MFCQLHILSTAYFVNYVFCQLCFVNSVLSTLILSNHDVCHMDLPGLYSYRGYANSFLTCNLSASKLHFQWTNDYKLNRKGTSLLICKVWKCHQNSTRQRKLHLKLEEVGEARLHGRVGLPAVTHNAKEPRGGRTETSEELGNCHVVEELAALFWTPPPTLPPPHLPLTAFWCDLLVLFEKIWKHWGEVEKGRGGGGENGKSEVGQLPRSPPAHI